MILDFLLTLSLPSWVCLLTFLVAVFYFISNRDSTSLPPTPGIALPILGHAYLLGKNPMPQFRKWRKTLGDVYMLYMGSRKVFVINGYENLKHTLVKQGDRSSDRPPSLLSGVVPGTHLGLIMSTGPNWKEQRTVTMTILREFGMGKNLLAEKIAIEAEDYLKDLEAKMGTSQDIRLLTNAHVSNIICSIIFGKRFDIDDPQFIRLLDIFNEQLTLAATSGVLNFIPWAKHIPFDPFKFKTILKNYYETSTFTRDMVNQSLEDSDPNRTDCYSAAYMRELNKKKESGADTYLDRENLWRNVAQLFFAGTETTSSTIMWFVLFMVHHPEIQEKIFKEIKEHVGLDRLPTMADKSKLKLLHATINESQRLGNIAPLNVSHFTSGPVEVKGYVIPPNCTVLPVLDSVLMDKEVWGDPENFRPDRFLDEDGNVVNKEELVPFSLGRRVCLGEALAKMELFLFLSAMFQRFKFMPEDPKKLPSLEPLFGAACPPLPYKVKLEKR